MVHKDRSIHKRAESLFPDIKFEDALSFVSSHTLRQNWNATKYMVGKHAGMWKGANLVHEPIRITAVITYRCNLRCSFCGVFALDPTIDKKYNDMPFSLYEEALNKFRGAFILGLGGGEPFLHKDIFKMIRYGRTRGMKVAINTNGTLIFDKTDQVIASTPSFLSVSLNACNAVEYSKINNAPSRVFEEVLQTIMKLVDKRDKEKKNIKLGISYVCTKENFRRMPEMLTLAQELRVNSVYFINLAPVPREGFTKDNCLYEDDRDVAEVVKNLGKSQIEVTGPNLYKKNFVKRQYHCFQPFEWTTVIPNADVFTCCVGVVRAGNIHDQNVWNNRTAQNFRRIMMSGDPLLIPDICKTCPNYVG